MGNPSLATLPRMDAGKPELSGPVRVRVLESERSAEWDRFVLSAASGSSLSSHRLDARGSKDISAISRVTSIAEREGQISGVLPLFSISNWVIGRVLNSVPFGVYGGVCAADDESRRALLDHAAESARSANVDFLELRARKSEPLEGFIQNPLYVTFTTDLSANHEANMKKLPRDTRYMIRKAEKAGLRPQHGMDQLGRILRSLRRQLQRHGTPAFPRRWLENLHAEFGEKMDLLVIRKDETAVAGVISFIFRDQILPYYAGAGPEAPRLAANNALYWELMKWAADAGLRKFDFGRSKLGTGSYDFKAQWNMAIEPLDYQILLVRRKTAPNFSPKNPKFERATRVWSRMPSLADQTNRPERSRWFP